jgi:uncharacterized peroxidase-related enzyme
LVAAVASDYRQAELSEADRGMLEFAEKLTRTPAAMSAADVDGLRRLGFGDAAIHDIVQVAALFNYYDRLADGMGIDPEPEWGPRPADW